MRSKQTWLKILDGKTLPEMAAFILSDLTGYPMQTRHKEEDQASLAAALEALVLRAECFSTRSREG